MMVEKFSRQVKRLLGRGVEKKKIKAVKVMEVYVSPETKDVIVRGSLPKDADQRYEFLGRLMITLANLMRKTKEVDNKSSIIKQPVGFNPKGGSS